MYNRQRSINTKASASLLPNNLAVKLNTDTGYADLLFLHKSVVHLLLSTVEPGSFNHRQIVCKLPSANEQMSFVMILQADWVEVAGRKILILATQKGIKMYEWDGSALVYWHGFGTDGGEAVFTRGIASVGNNTICIGTSSGQLLVFNVPSKGGNITFEEYLSGHDHSVTAIVARGDNIASADEDGNICIRKYRDGGALKLVHSIQGDGSPCNSIDIWKYVLAAGFSSGEMRLYDINTGRLLGEITAHARSLNALHIAQSSGLCVTASEDSYVRVWQLQAGPTLEVSHAFSDSIVDHQLVGAHFIDNDGRSFAVTAYDSSDIFVYHQ